MVVRRHGVSAGRLDHVSMMFVPVRTCASFDGYSTSSDLVRGSNAAFDGRCRLGPGTPALARHSMCRPNYKVQHTKMADRSNGEKLKWSSRISAASTQKRVKCARLILMNNVIWSEVATVQISVFDTSVGNLELTCKMLDTVIWSEIAT